MWLEQNEEGDRRLLTQRPDSSGLKVLCRDLTGNYKILTFILVEVGSHWMSEQKSDKI